MGALVVTTVCLLGVVTAGAIVLQFGRAPVVWRTRTDAEAVGGWPGARRVVRAVGVSLVSGVASGVLVAGLGSRLLMRIAAATSPDAQGALTEAEEVVGEITAGGTIGLVLFVGVFGGAVLGLFYRLVRPFLPGRAWLAGLVPTMVLAGAFGRETALTDPSNKDFAILEPTWLIAAMIGLLIVLFGATLGATHEWLDVHMPALSRRVRDVAWYLPILPTLLIPPVPATLAIGALVGAVTPASARDVLRAPAVRRVGMWALVSVATLATVRVVIDLAAIAA